MNEYFIRFTVKGCINVKAASMTSAVDRIMENFRDSGANQLHTEVVSINGEELKQDREGSFRRKDAE